MRANHHRVAALFILLGTTLVSLANAQAQQKNQPPDEVANSLKRNVVKLRSSFGDQLEEVGFGFVVSERAGKVYVVTAKHVVFNKDLMREATTVQVVFYSDQGNTYAAQTLQLNYLNFDLALIEIPKPMSFEWIKECEGQGVVRGTPVTFIGRSQTWYIPASPGFVNDVGPDNNIHVDISSVKPGSSGAPLVSDAGIAGLIFETIDGMATAYPISTIKKIVRDEWNYPWQLVPRTAPTPPTTNIKLWYDISNPSTGSYPNCGLWIPSPSAIKINGETLRAEGQNPITIYSVPVGEMSYQISATISCPIYGNCMGSGLGRTTVEANQEFNVIWRNVSVGVCNIELVPRN